MNPKTLKRWLANTGLLALVSVLWLTSCEPRGFGTDQQRRATPSRVPTASASVTPPHSPLPTPTRADGITPRFNGVWVTPLPIEKVKLGALTELASIPPPLTEPPPRRYIAQVLSRGEGMNRTSIVAVRDTQSGTEIARLGDDTGESVWDAMNDEYVIWWCGGCTSLKTGLYAYRIATGEQILISEDRGQYPKIDGEWVVYISDILPTGAELRAHNLVSGEDILITQDMAIRRDSYQGPGSRGDFFAVRDGRVVWATDLSTPGNPLHWGLSVYDIDTRTARRLNLPESLGHFSHLDVFGDTVLWQREFWQGYDLSRDAYFSIPIIPSGWENARITKISQVVASQGQLYWSLTIDGKERYFSAPIIPKE